MGLLTPAEAECLAEVEAQSRTMIEHVEAWTAVGSGSGHLAGLAALADLLQTAFGGLGAAVELRAPAAAATIDADGRERPLPLGRNLHLVQRPHAPLRLLLTGHMDTVFGPDHPFQHGRWLDGVRLNAPGAADMKGGLAIMLAALTAIERTGSSRSLGYEVVINADEEIGSPGSAPLLAEAAARCHLGLTYEPSLPDGTLAGARPGSGLMTAVIRGRAAHAGRNPMEGRNALLAAADLALRLEALARATDGLTINPAKLDGGGPANVVPELAILRWNCRAASRQATEAAARGIAAAAAAVEQAREVSVTLHGGFHRPPKPLDWRQAPLFERVRRTGLDLGLALGWRDTGGVCDGNNIAAAGLPVVDTLGARGDHIHSADEYLLVDSLVERARLSALLLMRLARDGAPA